jgi:hypothetical protein
MVRSGSEKDFVWDIWHYLYLAISIPCFVVSHSCTICIHTPLRRLSPTIGLIYELDSALGMGRGGRILSHAALESYQPN